MPAPPFRLPERGESFGSYLRLFLGPSIRNVSFAGSIQGEVIGDNLSLYVPTQAAASDSGFWARIVQSDDEVHTIQPVVWENEEWVIAGEELEPAYEVNGAENVFPGDDFDEPGLVVWVVPSVFEGETVWLFDLNFGALNGDPLDVPINEDAAIDTWQRGSTNKDGFKMQIVTRLFVDQSEKKFYYFWREASVDSNGHWYAVSEETREELASEDCDFPDEE